MASVVLLIQALLLLFVNAAEEKEGAFINLEDFMIYEKIRLTPHVAGIRIENDDETPGFLGYTPAGETIVEPETKVVVNLFGERLEMVEYVTFTESNCFNSEFNISALKFHKQTDRRIKVPMSFRDIEPSWKICIKPRKGEIKLVEGVHTYISTSATIEEHYMPLYAQVVLLAVLLLTSALCSGLNLGLMSLSLNELQLIINCGLKHEKKYAKAIYPIRKRGNYLLCTILLMNVVVNASISILFEDLTSGTVAFVVSSAGIVIFGEIVPQSICVKKGLAVGAKTVWLMKMFMLLTFPLSYPISKILDYLLGEEVDKFDRKRLLELMKMSAVDCPEDLKIAVGAMELPYKRVRDIMTKIEDVYMLSTETILTSNVIQEIHKQGYTRVPIYEGSDYNKIVSLLYVRELALVDKNAGIKAKTIANKERLRFVPETMLLTKLLEEFKEGQSHLAMVMKVSSDEADNDFLHSTLGDFQFSDPSLQLVGHSTEIIGLITLEDIVEEILQAEINDETDTVSDNVRRRKRMTKMSVDYRKFVGQEKRCGKLSTHEEGVLRLYLQNHHPLFASDILDPKAFSKLIDVNLRQVHVNADNPPVPLYEFGVQSKRAIVILEGSATVSFPKHSITLNAGPWISFGSALLLKLENQLIHLPNESHAGITFMPDFSLCVEKYCKFVQLPIPALNAMLKYSKLVKTFQINEPQLEPKPSVASMGASSQLKVRFKDEEDRSRLGRKASYHGVGGLLAVADDSRLRSISNPHNAAIA